MLFVHRQAGTLCWAAVSQHEKPPCPRKQSQDDLQADSVPREADSTGPNALNYLCCGHFTTIGFFPSTSSPTVSDEICRTFATQIVKLLNTLNLKIFINLLAFS